MTKLALARRYRPRTFQTMVGQEVTLRALKNALDTKRLHHAYLFTGTRGVGKTTLARLLAKSLSCELGISSTPCGTCGICKAIDEGSFVDLLEVDAASRTKVEDTRELLDNVQYLPTRGRYKIYLIDEVHMLSGHSFNALLKTLEEPPSHVIFLLATTDPQKLPVTVLSRCLQFHLHRLALNKIVEQLQFVLNQEGARFESEALLELARAGDGSMRDALSLLDQALAYGVDEVKTDAVRSMLGLSSLSRLITLLRAVFMGKGEAVFSEINLLAETTPDFAIVLKELMTLLHQIAVAQQVPQALDETLRERSDILKLSEELPPEEVQLYYQIALQGQRDLPFAPDPQMGFEMVLLRMLAFHPAKITDRIPEKIKIDKIDKREVEKNEVNAVDWHELVPKLKLSGLIKELAQHCVVEQWSLPVIQLILEEAHAPLLNKRYQEQLCQALSQLLGDKINLKISIGKIQEETLGSKNQRLHQENLEALQKDIETDPQIQKMIQTFDAKIEDIQFIQ